MKYSVIITTYNRAESLPRTLACLAYQEFPPAQFEVLVMDDGSKDNTRIVVEEFKKNHPKINVRYFYWENRGSAAAKNRGVREARGEFVVFTDDDIWITANWLEAFDNGFKKYPEVVGVGGWFRPPDDEARFFQKTAHKEKLIFYKDYIEHEKILESFLIPLAFTSNVAYRKSALIEAGGFDEKIKTIYGIDLKYRLMNIHKKKILGLPLKYAVIHQCPLNWRQYLKKHFKQGRCRQYCLRKYYGDTPPRFADLGFTRLPRRFIGSIKKLTRFNNISRQDFINFTTFSLLVNLFVAAGALYEKRVIKYRR